MIFLGLRDLSIGIRASGFRLYGRVRPAGLCPGRDPKGSQFECLVFVEVALRSIEGLAGLP